MTDIKLTIDGQEVTVPKGTTFMQAAQQAGIEIPVLCYFAHTTANGLCRLCVVEVEGARTLQASCVAEAWDEAVVHTRSEKVDRARRTILEMLASTVDLSEAPEVLAMMETYGAEPSRFEGGKKRQPEIIDDNPVYMRDYAKCVMCWRCVQVCADDAQYTYALTFNGRGFNTSIGTFLNKPIPETTCVFCGQCVGVCPTGALIAKREYLFEQGYSPDEIYNQTKIRGKGKQSQRGPRLDS
ncbi:MAG: 2Fe-2S iron-sulfur cluster-binding protein [Anaerolineales bacterium]